MLIPPVGGSTRANAGGGKQSAAITSQAASTGRAFERAHVAADVGAVTGERHPLRVEPQLEPSEAHHVSGRLERHAVRRRRQLERPRLAPLDPGSGRHQRQAADDQDLVVLDELGDHRRDRPALADLAHRQRRRAHPPRAQEARRHRAHLTARRHRLGGAHRERAHVAAVHPDQRRPPGVEVDQELARTVRRPGLSAVVRSNSVTTADPVSCVIERSMPHFSPVTQLR